jgi:hypothetical protein
VSIIDETRFVERLQFFNGQRLFASDLQGLEAFNREMRWLHNRSLHQPGVGNGFAVNGRKEDRLVTIRAGYATDSLGREIILTEPETFPIPPVAAINGEPVYFDLTVAYPDDSTLEESERREGICGGNGAIRLREAPVFCWVELAGEQRAPKKQKLKAELEAGLRIRLARIQVLNCQLYADVSIAERLNARPPALPYIFSRTQSLPTEAPELTVVRNSLGNQSDSMDGLIMSGIVKTHDAEFLTIPEYSAHLIGPRQFQLHTTAPNINAIIFDQLQITTQTLREFQFLDLLLVIGPDLDTQDVLNKQGQVRAGVTRLNEVEEAIRANWKLVWMGVEG